MLILTLLLAMQDAPLPEITVTQAEPDRYVVEVARFPVSDKYAVDNEMARVARKRCGDKDTAWGVLQTRGPTVGEAEPSYTMYRRDFQCLERDTAVYPRAPDDWHAKTADESDARDAFASYFGKLNSGDLEGAYAMFDPRSVPNRGDWLANQRRAMKSVGAGTARVTAIHWEVNPSDQRHPGVFATLVFDGDYADADAVCGLVTVYRRGRGDYVLVGQEFNFLLKKDNPMSPEDVAAAKRERCPR